LIVRNNYVWMVFYPHFHLPCLMCLQRLQDENVQKLQTMSAMLGKANNVHSVLQSSVYHLDISRMRIVTMQRQENPIFFRQLHRTDKIFEPLRKTLFLDPSSFVTSRY
jgi:hypothetical protein